MAFIMLRYVPSMPSFWRVFIINGCWILLLAFSAASLVAQRIKNLPAMQEAQVQSLGQEDPLEKEMTTHSGTLAWKNPRTEEPGRLQSTGLQRVRHDSDQIIIWFLSFNLLMWCITLIDLQILKNPCILGIKPTWLWCMIFLICCWILFAKICLKIFASCSSVILSCSFLFLSFFLFFFLASLSDFGIRVMVAS